jgi:hypothetical protein
VCRADVAAVCAAALTDPAAAGVTFELVHGGTKGGAAPPPLAQQVQGIFQGLQPDAR